MIRLLQNDPMNTIRLNYAFTEILEEISMRQFLQGLLLFGKVIIIHYFIKIC